MATKTEAYKALDGTLFDTEAGAAEHDLKQAIMRLISKAKFPHTSAQFGHLIGSEDETRREIARILTDHVAELFPLINALSTARHAAVKVLGIQAGPGTVASLE